MFLAAIQGNRIDGLTLSEAFGLPWVDIDERTGWTRLYADGLRGAAEQAEGQLEAQRRREALQKVAKQTQIRG